MFRGCDGSRRVRVEPCMFTVTVVQVSWVVLVVVRGLHKRLRADTARLDHSLVEILRLEAIRRSHIGARFLHDFLHLVYRGSLVHLAAHLLTFDIPLFYRRASPTNHALGCVATAHRLHR